MKNSIEVQFTIDESDQERLLAELIDFGFDGFEQFPHHFLALHSDEERFSSIRSELENLIDHHFPGVFIENIRTIAPKNWNEEWEKSIQPLHVGEFYIYPSWKSEGKPSQSVLLEIDPKMAFGTGFHETTRLMLQGISKWVKEGDSVLDVGTGTGILAIAALKKGAKHALGFDIDEWSKENAEENARRNQVESHFQVFEGSFEVVDSNRTFDVVLANVNRVAILELQQELVQHLTPGGILLLSGILEVEQHLILEAPSFQSLRLLHSTKENEWVSIAYQRK